MILDKYLFEIEFEIRTRFPHAGPNSLSNPYINSLIRIFNTKSYSTVWNFFSYKIFCIHRNLYLFAQWIIMWILFPQPEVITNFQSLGNPEVQCRIPKGSPIIPILGRINPIPCIDTYLFKVNSNIVLPSTIIPT